VLMLAVDQDAFDIIVIPEIGSNCNTLTRFELLVPELGSHDLS